MLIEIIKNTFIWFAAILAFVGIIGGILALPHSIKSFRKSLKQHGDKGVGFCVMGREDKPDEILVKFLVVEDLFQFISNLVKPDFNGKVKTLNSAGDYYEIVIAFPPNSDLKFFKSKKS
jgi:hypothetical protein